MKIVDMSVTPIHPERWGDDLDVVNAARVSFSKVSEKFTDQDAKLINYLAKHQHFSPFNHSFLSFRMKAPIFVARQLVKHKFMPWNEVSRRYVDDEPEFFYPTEWRKRAVNVKQGSSDERCDAMYEEQDMNMLIPWESEDFWVRSLMENVVAQYQCLLDKGVAPEQARMMLPQNMMTEWIWSGTLGAFLSMIKLRLDNHAQYESRVLITELAKYVKQYFPASYAANIGDTNA